MAQESTVRYRSAHVDWLLRALRWTPQQPMLRASERNAAANAEWKQKRQPDLHTQTPRTTERLIWSIIRGLLTVV